MAPRTWWRVALAVAGVAICSGCAELLTPLQRPDVRIDCSFVGAELADVVVGRKDYGTVVCGTPTDYQSVFGGTYTVAYGADSTSLGEVTIKRRDGTSWTVTIEGSLAAPEATATQD